MYNNPYLYSGSHMCAFTPLAGTYGKNGFLSIHCHWKRFCACSHDFYVNTKKVSYDTFFGNQFYLVNIIIISLLLAINLVIASGASGAC